jgi:hypothetical protein
MPMEPTPQPQALRPSSLAPYTPPERKKDGTVIAREPEADFPSPPRQPVQNITAFPPPLEPAMPEEEGENIGDAPIYLEPYGEDAPPDEPPAYLAEDNSEPVLPEPEDEKTPATPSAKSFEPNRVPQYVPPGFSLKDEQPEPERLPIDLGALMQRPTAPPPVLDQPVEPPAIIEQPKEPKRLRQLSRSPLRRKWQNRQQFHHSPNYPRQRHLQALWSRLHLPRILLTTPWRRHWKKKLPQAPHRARQFYRLRLRQPRRKELRRQSPLHRCRSLAQWSRIV